MNPFRTCIVCRKKGPKEDFVKIVKNKNGEITIDTDRWLDGRGAYICKSEECVLKNNKTKALNRAFKCPVPNEIYEELILIWRLVK